MMIPHCLKANFSGVPRGWRMDFVLYCGQPKWYRHSGRNPPLRIIDAGSKSHSATISRVRMLLDR